MSLFVPIIFIVKMEKIWVHVLLENQAHTERKSVFLIETLCIFS